VRVKLVMMRNFMLCSMTAGLVGIFEAVRAASGQSRGRGSPFLDLTPVI
jgi:predicted ABC-type sugar transport system permease subunit